jgi:lysine biosynthesis protein LysW
MTSDTQKTNPKCPECDTLLDPNTNYSIGKIIECPACATESEVVTVNPLTLAPLEEEK